MLPEAVSTADCGGCVGRSLDAVECIGARLSICCSIGFRHLGKPDGVCAIVVWHWIRGRAVIRFVFMMVNGRLIEVENGRAEPSQDTQPHEYVEIDSSGRMSGLVISHIFSPKFT